MNGDEEKKTPIGKTAELSRDDPISSTVTSKSDDRDNLKQSDGSGASPSPSTKDTATTNTTINKAKSCKGCLYYSSHMKANSRNPICAGLTRSLPNCNPNFCIVSSPILSIFVYVFVLLFA